EVLDLAGGGVGECDDIVAAGDQRGTQLRADAAGAAGNEDVCGDHARPALESAIMTRTPESAGWSECYPGGNAAIPVRLSGETRPDSAWPRFPLGCCRLSAASAR